MSEAVIDANGDVVLTGRFSGTVDFGGGPITSATNGSVFVLKLDGSGTHIWSKGFGETPQFTSEHAIALDVDGNVILTGSVQGPIDFGGGSLAPLGLDDVYLAKLTTAGEHVWSRRFGNAGTQVGHAVATDAAGNVIIAGRAQGAEDFGGGPISQSARMFLTKFDASGSHLWSEGFQSSFFAMTSADVATDASGNVGLALQAQGEIDFGGGLITGAQWHEAFVARFDAEGLHTWSKRFGGNGYDAASRVIFDDGGNLILAGTHAGTVDFGGGPITNQSAFGPGGPFVAAFSAAGDHIWSVGYDAPPPDSNPSHHNTAVALDPTGNLILAGLFRFACDFGGGPISGDLFFAKLAPP